MIFVVIFAVISLVSAFMAGFTAALMAVSRDYTGLILVAVSLLLSVTNLVATIGAWEQFA